MPKNLDAEALASAILSARESFSRDGLTIEGELDLSQSEIPVAVSLTNCTFKGPVNLSSAWLKGSVNLSGSTFSKGLSMEGARVGHHLLLSGCKFQAPLNTSRLEVLGDLVMSEATLAGLWWGEDMQFKGSLLLKELKVEGEMPPEVNLARSHIGGQISFAQARLGRVVLTDTRATARLYLSKIDFAKEGDFSGVKVGAGLTCRSCQFQKEARFPGAHIGGQANFLGVQFGDKVAFDGVEVKGDLFFRPDEKGNPCTIKGEARFLGAHIGGQANFRGVQFGDDVFFSGATIGDDANIWEVKLGSLVAEGARFTKALDLSETEITGGLNLKDGKVGSLNISGMKRLDGGIVLTGCEYASVDSKDKLLKLMRTKRVVERQPYEFLENYSRRIGERDFANEVYYHWCKLNRSRINRIKKLHVWLWDSLLWLIAGYGVKPVRLVWWSLFILFAGLVLFQFPSIISPVGYGGNMPRWWEALALSLINLVPIQIEHIRTSLPWQLTPLGTYIATLLRAFGWFVIGLGTLAVAGLFRRLER